MTYRQVKGKVEQKLIGEKNSKNSEILIVFICVDFFPVSFQLRFIFLRGVLLLFRCSLLFKYQLPHYFRSTVDDEVIFEVYVVAASNGVCHVDTT